MAVFLNTGTGEMVEMGLCKDCGYSYRPAEGHLICVFRNGLGHTCETGFCDKYIPPVKANCRHCTFYENGTCNKVTGHPRPTTEDAACKWMVIRSD